MRTSSLLLVGGLLGALLSAPAAAQERGPRFERRALPQEPARRPPTRPEAERPVLEGLRARLLERFDADGDGRLDGAERGAARRAWIERRGYPAGPDAAPRHGEGGARPGAARRFDRPLEPQRPARPLLERLIERARQLPPHERAILRRRLAERFGESEASRGPRSPKAGSRPFERLEPQRPLPPRRGPDAQRVPLRRGPGFGAPEHPARRFEPRPERPHGPAPAPVPERRRPREV